ncbi:MAG TPA: PfkB family carbohydrate kinase, partial [Fimbriimonas sp.]|nr:PfkB family carbohydrate kinase [Fimbriimonas sp.]
EYEALKRRIGEFAPSYAWTLIAGSLPLDVPKTAFFELGEQAHLGGSKVAVDGDGEVQIEALKLKPQLVKPNSAEASRLLGMDINGTDDAVFASRKLYEMIGGGERYALISRGKDGAVLTCADGSFVGESPRVEPKSTIGSGDSMIAGFLFALSKSMKVDECLRWGMAAGAATALTDGSAIGDGETTRRLLSMAKVTSL